MQAAQAPPLILTLALDSISQAFFNQQRSRYFPAERNHLQAHLTLFHHLPNNDYTRDILKQLNSTPFQIQITGLMNLGNGVAYRVASPQLAALRQNLKNAFAGQLIAQDQQGFRPHITIQNKVLPEVARQLLANLSADFEPFECAATGLSLWAYLGGPWEHVADFDFGDGAARLRID